MPPENFKRSYFDFCATGWRTATMGLKLEEEAVFLRIVLAIFENGGPIEYPNDWLKYQCRVSARKWKGIRQSLLDSGCIVIDDGYLYHTLDWETKRRPMSQRLRDKIFDDAGGNCEYCGTEVVKTPDPVDNQFQVDHYIPLSAGGLDIPSNLRASCRSCNKAKGTMIPPDVAGVRK